MGQDSRSRVSISGRRVIWTAYTATATPFIKVNPCMYNTKLRECWLMIFWQNTNLASTLFFPPRIPGTTSTSDGPFSLMDRFVHSYIVQPSSHVFASQLSDIPQCWCLVEIPSDRTQIRLHQKQEVSPIHSTPLGVAQITTRISGTVYAVSVWLLAINRGGVERGRSLRSVSGPAFSFQ